MQELHLQAIYNSEANVETVNADFKCDTMEHWLYIFSSIFWI